MESWHLWDALVRLSLEMEKSERCGGERERCGGRVPTPGSLEAGGRRAVLTDRGSTVGRPQEDGSSSFRRKETIDHSLFMNSRSSSTPSMEGSSVLFSLRKPCRAGQDPENNGRQS